MVTSSGTSFRAWGVRQGDPLALLLFALSLQDCFEQALGDNVTPVAISDDLEIAGEAEDVFLAYDRVVSAQEKEGVERESDKRFVLWLHDERPPDFIYEECESRGLKLIAGGLQPNGAWRGGCAEVLGCMFSMHHDDVAQWLCAKVLDHEDFFEGLEHKDLGAQNAISMLKYCGSSRMNYLSRTVPPSDFAEGAAAFDDLVLRALENILQLEFRRGEDGSVDPTDTKVCALRRSIKKAGFGFRSMSFISPIAFYAAGAKAAPANTHSCNPRLSSPWRCTPRAPNPSAQPSMHTRSSKAAARLWPAPAREPNCHRCP